jgi:leader peptidase (prepilin peptidase) / N-methyltransferase
VPPSLCFPARVNDDARGIAQFAPSPGLRCSVVTAFVSVVAGMYGLVVGSFLNVVIWRVPRKESIVKPRSHCPSCDTQLSALDNIPLVSWMVLRGRCRHCGNRISMRYPLVELLTGVLFAAVGARFSHSWALPAFLVFTGALIAISVIDLEHFIIPNRIVYPLGFTSVFLLAFAALVENEWSMFGRSLLGALAAFTFFFVLHLVAPGGMGFGDVRLSFVLGLFLGWLGWPEVLGGLFAGFLC